MNRWTLAPVMIAVALALAGCAMPAATPLRGQDTATIERDRSECKAVAQTDPSITTATTPGGGEATYWLLGGPASAVDQQLTAQREAAFNACMESRGYATEKR
jgi:hypothetical protein